MSWLKRLPFQNQFRFELEISKIPYRNKFHELATCHIWYILCPLKRFCQFSSAKVYFIFFAKNSKILDWWWKYSPTKFFRKTCFQKWFPQGFIFTLKFTGLGNNSNNSPSLAGTLSKNVDTVGYCFFSVMIKYENFLINYHKITKVIIVKILDNGMNVLINGEAKLQSRKCK